MPEFKDFKFDSSTGCNRIHARIILPEGKPKAIFQISHGIAEHIGRYEEFMQFLSENGYAAVANDHLGHGGSIAGPGEQGFFADRNGWFCVVNDMKRLHDLMAKEIPGVPYILFGHSMGSFLTRTYLVQYPDAYDLAILSGTGHQPRALILGGYAMAQMEVSLKGAHTLGDTLNGVAFGSYNQGFYYTRTDYDWLSCDDSVVDRYISDPLCGFVCTNSLYRDMMQGLLFITDKKNLSRMNRKKPVYFMSGAADPVGENGKGVERAYQAFCDAGMQDVTMRLYPGGRHEMLNELNKEQVKSDILAWISQRL